MKFTEFLQKDGKYLIAYIAPVAAFYGFQEGGIWSPGAVYVAFVCVPLLEIFIGGSEINFSGEEELRRSKKLFFDVLLYLNVPILYSLLWMYGQRLTSSSLNGWEIIGMTLNMGLIAGVCGINVAHELGHRNKLFDKVLAWILLVPALYMHFYIEHNRGHHRWVGTPHDPASAKKSEWIYTFWIRSIAGGWLNAWRLEANRLAKAGQSPWTLQNQMLLFQIIQILYLLLWYFLAGWPGVLAALGVALGSILLLESINYIEHYGLRRAVFPNGHYEKIGPQHSWNSDHHLGRIFLYELTRHSDHHFKANRKYQLLRHFDESPQLPMGYPGAILLALVPPFWFRTMDQAVERWNKEEKKLSFTQD